MTSAPTLLDFLAEHLTDVETAWSVGIKRRVVEFVVAGQGPSEVGMAADRFTRAAVRVALRQLQAVEGNSPAVVAWLSAYDRFDPDEPNNSMGDHPCTA